MGPWLASLHRAQTVGEVDVLTDRPQAALPLLPRPGRDPHRAIQKQRI